MCLNPAIDSLHTVITKGPALTHTQSPAPHRELPDSGQYCSFHIGSKIENKTYTVTSAPNGQARIAAVLYRVQIGGKSRLLSTQVKTIFKMSRILLLGIIA